MRRRVLGLGPNPPEGWRPSAACGPGAAAIAIAAGSVAVAIGAACGFPDPVLLDLDGGPRPSSDAPVVDTGAGDGDTPVADGGAEDADATVSCATPCDCDGDGFLDLACDGGTDCDDHDDRRKPDAGYRSEVPTAPNDGDWNCSGVVEREFDSGIACSNYSMALCMVRRGFTGPSPDCGGNASFHTCRWNPAGAGSCTFDPKNETQRCR